MNNVSIAIDPSLIAAFRSTELPLDQILHCHIEQESFVLSRSTIGKQTESLSGSIRPLLAVEQPSLLLVRSSANPDPTKWLFVSWIPDQAHVQLKMRYSSAKDSLKTALGTEHFQQEIHLSSLSDCSEAFFSSKLSSLTNDVPYDGQCHLLTDIEKTAYAAIRESVPISVRQAAMPQINLNEELEVSLAKSLQALSSSIGAKTTQVVCVALTSNCDGFVFDAALSVSSDGQLPGWSSCLTTSEPRFILVTKSGKTILIHYNPEGSDRRLKMSYSTFKRNLVDLCSKFNIVVDYTSQVTSPDQIPVSLRDEFSNGSDVQPVLDESFAKPVRPGRGKARVIQQ